MKQKTRISKITVARLYNLGNYEHVRYELAVDVPAGESALAAFKNIMVVLRAANPKGPVAEYDLRRAQDWLKARDKSKRVINSGFQGDQVASEVKVRTEDAKSKIRKHNRHLKIRAQAERVMREMGGTTAYKDAKFGWDEFGE